MKRFGLLLTGLLLICNCISARDQKPPTSPITDLRIIVESVKQVRKDFFDIRIRVTNTSAKSFFLEESGKGDGIILHSAIAEKWFPSKGWVFVGPSGDIGASTVIELKTGETLTSIVRLHEPYLPVFSETFSREKISIMGKLRIEIRYFETKDAWKSFFNQIHRRENRHPKVKPKRVYSDPFEIDF